ncbi:MAG: hypothetical protein NW241_12045 [Bacteroidia bacterium]|nr:hypothetical protein [Bacteroidia bacterium]
MNILRACCAAWLLLLGGSAAAQGPAASEETLYRLMDSGFLSTYKDYRAEIEQYAALFKSRKDHSPEDIVRMRSAYLRTSEAFEDFILSVRNDLLDRKIRREIRKDTEGYVRRKLEKLNATYVEHFQGRFKPTYIAIVSPEAPAPDPSAMASAAHRDGIPVALIAPLAQAMVAVIDFLDKKNDRDIEALKEVLQKEWVEPNRFTKWENIVGG